MANIQFGATVTGIRGTINGITFSANSTSNYVKSWARPPLARSAALSLSRSRLTTAANQWQALSGPERTAWDLFAAAPNEPDFDAWGFQRWITGFQWFVRATARRALAGLDYDVTPPTGAGLAAPTGFTIFADAPGTGSAAVAWTSATFPAGAVAILYLTATPSQACIDVWRGWKLTLALQNPGDTGEDLTALLEPIFGSIPASWWFFGRLFHQAELGNRSAAAATSVQITLAP